MRRHPFDARRSGRDPFPCFAAAMAEVASDSDAGSDSGSANGASGSDYHTLSPRFVAGGCTCDGADGDDDGSRGSCTCDAERVRFTPSTSATATTTAPLDWSIDGLATLLPRAFSPPTFQFTRRRLRSTRHHLRRRRRWSTGTTATLPADDDDDLLLLSEDDQEETPLRSTTFFEDESQFGVLRTPADVIEQERQQQQQEHDHPGAMAVGEYAAWCAASTESTARWRELHRRCVDTIQVCEARVRERQQRLARLPIPATKLALHHRSSQRLGRGGATRGSGTATVPFSGSGAERIHMPREPLTPVVPTRLRFGSIDLSPIPQDSAHKASLRVHDTPDDPKTPTMPARATAPAGSTGTRDGASAFSSPALSSIAEHASDVLTPSFASLQFSASRDIEEEENKENASSARQLNSLSASNTSSSLSDPSPSSLHTESLLGGHGGGSSSSRASSSSPGSFPSPFSALSTTSHERHEGESIAARQLSFVAAIEEEAKQRDAATETKGYQRRSAPPPPAQADSSTSGDQTATSTTDSSPCSFRSRTTTTPLLPACTPPATSMASIYKEARALGITEPTAQWEYVQLIRRQTMRRREPAKAARVSF